MTLNEKIPYINLHSHFPSENRAISIFNAGIDSEAFQKHEFLSIGIHPWYIRQLNIESALDFIKQNAGSQKVIFIGECGLDKLTDVSMDEQEQVFIEQIRIAEKVKKPILIHCVKAFEELIRIKKEQKVSVPMIVHGYNNKQETAQQLINHGFYLSFGKALLQDESNAQKVIFKTDYKNFFLETDDANTSIKTIFEKASQLKKISIGKMMEQMMQNYKTLLK